MWLGSVNGDRKAAYLISVGGVKYLVVVVGMVLVIISLVLRGQNWLSLKAGNVRRGVRCAVGASEGLS